MRKKNELIAGFERFRRKYFGGDNQLFDRLKVAQQPSVLVIACSDSRVDPAILLDAEPGEMFVIRNVANLVPPHAGDHGTHGVSAALEFAVRSLKVSDIIILGHSQCGGIQALLKGEAGEYITKWMQIAQEAAADIRRSNDVIDAQSARVCEQRSILLSLNNLLTFPWIRERVESGELAIHGWYFDITQGEIEEYDAESAEFRPLRGNTNR